MNAPALPYGLHTIEEDDVEAVRVVLEAEAARFGQLDEDDIEAALSVLRGPLLAQGPEVARFEQAFAAATDAKYAVASSSGTAALHLALAAVGVQEGDTCIVPAITFVATATAARFCGARVVFADVDPSSGLMTPETLTEAIGRAGGRVKAVLPVHLGGRLCATDQISKIAGRAGAIVIEDACHALGSIGGVSGKAGSSKFSAASVFSFHPVKTIACGEGGMVTTNDPEISARVQRLRNHGVTRDPDLMVDRELSFDSAGRPNPWSYEQLELGFNYRMTDIEAVLGASQLKKLEIFVEKRRHLVRLYNELLAPLSPFLRPVSMTGIEETSFHIYSINIRSELLQKRKAGLVSDLLARGIGTQVHYIPIYRQPYFVEQYGAQLLRGAEEYYSSTLTLPMFPRMTEDDVRRVVLEVTAAVSTIYS